MDWSFIFINSQDKTLWMGKNCEYERLAIMGVKLSKNFINNHICQILAVNKMNVELFAVKLRYLSPYKRDHFLGYVVIRQAKRSFENKCAVFKSLSATE